RHLEMVVAQEAVVHIGDQAQPDVVGTVDRNHFDAAVRDLSCDGNRHPCLLPRRPAGWIRMIFDQRSYLWYEPSQRRREPWERCSTNPSESALSRARRFRSASMESSRTC